MLWGLNAYGVNSGFFFTYGIETFTWRHDPDAPRIVGKEGEMGLIAGDDLLGLASYSDLNERYIIRIRSSPGLPPERTGQDMPSRLHQVTQKIASFLCIYNH